MIIIIGGTIPLGTYPASRHPWTLSRRSGRKRRVAERCQLPSPPALSDSRRGRKTPAPPASPEGREEPGLPPLTAQAASLFQSVVAFVGDGCGIVDDQQYGQRWKSAKPATAAGKRCAACGCWINVKARGRAFRCPIGRWR